MDERQRHRPVRLKPHNTKYTLGRGNFSVEEFPKGLSEHNGILPLSVFLDLTVGEEIALYWLDHTPFIEELSAVQPFQFFLRCGLFRSDYGPLLWMLFYVPNPCGGSQPFASVECHLNPSASDQVDLWRRLSNQTHWHLTLIGAQNRVANFFEFENVYLLGDALDTMERACRGLHVTDFMRAKQQFWDTYTMQDLFEMV